MNTTPPRICADDDILIIDEECHIFGERSCSIDQNAMENNNLRETKVAKYTKLSTACNYSNRLIPALRNTFIMIWTLDYSSQFEGRKVTREKHKKQHLEIPEWSH